MTHEKGSVRHEYDRETKKGEEVMLGIDLKIRLREYGLKSQSRRPEQIEKTCLRGCPEKLKIQIPKAIRARNAMSLSIFCPQPREIQCYAPLGPHGRGPSLRVFLSLAALRL